MSHLYPLTSSERERRRLRLQAESMLPLTQRMLGGAGLAQGSQVLELGCGGGDVTLLIAERVGASGRVLAVDRDPAQIAAAAQRVAQAGYTNVDFLQSEIDLLQPPQAYDAVVGRYVLIYAIDPEAVVARAATWLRPGGALGFVEMNFFRGMRGSIWPPASAAAERAMSFIGDVMLDAGVQTEMAARLPSMLSRYGAVQAEISAPLQFGASAIELPLEAVRSVLPTARRLGRADALAHDVDALLATELAARDQHSVVVPPLSVAAWVRVV